METNKIKGEIALEENWKKIKAVALLLDKSEKEIQAYKKEINSLQLERLGIMRELEKERKLV